MSDRDIPNSTSIDVTAWVMENSAPRAICEAALKAINSQQ